MKWEEIEQEFLRRGLGFLMVATPPTPVTGPKSLMKQTTSASMYKEKTKQPLVRQLSIKITKEHKTKERLHKHKQPMEPQDSDVEEVAGGIQDINREDVEPMSRFPPSI